MAVCICFDVDCVLSVLSSFGQNEIIGEEMEKEERERERVR